MRVLMVEDEAMVARLVARRLREALGDELDHLASAADLDTAEQLLATEAFDVLLLDLNLEGEDGFRLLERAAAGRFQTIVVSANTHRALEAFEYGVLDFVPKPVTVDRLAKAFRRSSDADAVERPALRYLMVRHRDRLERIPVHELRAVHGAGDYAELELADGTRRLHDKPLWMLDPLLGDGFLRIHRSHIIRLARARALTRRGDSGYELELDDGSRWPIGRRWLASVREALGVT